MIYPLPPYNHQLVQDLAWAIASPPLPLPLTVDIPERVTVHTTEWYLNQYMNAKELLHQLDRQPYQLGEFIARQEKHRLGFYFESLIQFWLQHHSHFELIEMNRPVSEHGITVGEFDFIFYDSENKKTIHMEAACKFYLGVDTANKIKYIGPGLNDLYDKKIERLFHHQLMLSDQTAGIDYLQNKNLHIDERWLFLKGRLFNPALNGELTDSWIDINQFSKLIFSEETRFVELRKHQWLGKQHNINAHYLSGDIYNQADLIRKLKSDNSEHPLCIAAVENNSEKYRFFITSVNWQQKATTLLNY